MLDAEVHVLKQLVSHRQSFHIKTVLGALLFAGTEIKSIKLGGSRSSGPVVGVATLYFRYPLGSNPRGLALTSECPNLLTKALISSSEEFSRSRASAFPP